MDKRGKKSRQGSWCMKRLELRGKGAFGEKCVIFVWLEARQ